MTITSDNITEGFAVPRPWKVTIHATVTTDVEYESSPGYAGSMTDAIDTALDHFRMEHERNGYKITKIEAVPNEEDGAALQRQQEN